MTFISCIGKYWEKKYPLSLSETFFILPAGVFRKDLQCNIYSSI